MSAAPLRVMLVDDHQVVRDGIKLLLARRRRGRVRRGGHRPRRGHRGRPGPARRDRHGRTAVGRQRIEATRDIRAARPQTQVLMLTSFADDEALFASIMAGASRLCAQADPQPRAAAGHPGRRGRPEPARPGRDQGVLDRLRKHKQLVTDEKLARLSPQEERILGRVAEG